MTAPNDVAALVERLRALVIMDEVGSDNPMGRDAADLIATQAATIAALQAEVERAKTYWMGWARKRATVQETAWMRAAELAVAGDLRALKNRIDMVKAGPIAIELSEAARSASRKENTP